jgi:GDSL-like Lipase/Acylhydrolase
VKNLFQFTFGIWLFASNVLPASAAFSSINIFGDALSAMADTNYPSPGSPLYYGLRWSNGRVWVEVLAQRQNIPINYNNSYFDHNSSITVADVNGFTSPPDVANDLFVVWVCNADTFDAAFNVVNDNNQNQAHLLNEFVGENMVSQTNHFQIITNLYAKGVRTLIMPNVVDISRIPAFNAGSVSNVLHAGCVDYNARFVIAINQAKAMCPGLTIYTPDFFTLLNNVLTNAAYYGLTNALSGGLSIDALDDLYSSNPVNLDSAGTNYIFWDPKDPTARLHAVIADITQQIISPVQVGKIAPVTGSNRLDIVNYPAGLDGFVDALTNLALANWSAKITISSSNTTQSVFVPVSGPQQFYRLRFPYAWSWP